MKNQIVVFLTVIFWAVSLANLSSAQEATTSDPLNEAQRKAADHDWTGAKVAYTQYIVLHPQNPEGYEGRGVANYQLSKYDAALEDLNQAVAFRAYSADLFYFRGLLQYRKQDYRQAILDLTKAIKEGVGQSDAYYTRGSANFRTEN